MKRNLFWVIMCLVTCLVAYRFGGAGLEEAKRVAMERIYLHSSQLMLPQLYVYGLSKEELFYHDLEELLMPVIACFRGQTVTASYGTAGGQDKEEAVSMQQGNSEMINHDDTVGMGNEYQESVNAENVMENEAAAQTGTSPVLQKQVEINRAKLQDFDYLRQNFYQVDNTTTVGSDLLNAVKFLEKDMRIQAGISGPQILIYHTHSQEGYADSVPGDANTSVVAVGDYLEQLLEEKYGISVLHHKGQYDVESRNTAYSNALPHIEQILNENPTIEVVIDLHRDGVPDNLHLVSEVNGKATAQIMFFNGLSRTTSQGALEYLANPYIEDNLAFSFQLQLAAEEYYPGFARNIYLKGYRYNLHLRPKSILVEVGAQNNTFEEAKNAMEPLANILAKVLLENY